MTEKDKDAKLEQLRIALKPHYGAINEIASITGLTRETVRLALRGDISNYKVLKVAAEVLQTRTMKRKKAFQAIDSALTA